jgi:protein O-GlcNAc transferase
MDKPELHKIEIDSIIALFSDNKLQEALDKVKTLTKSFPKDSLLHNITGACYAGLGQLGSAVKSYEKAIEIKPDYAKAFYNLGGTYHELEKMDDSIKSYKRSLEIDPDYAEAHNNLGNVFQDLGRLDEAFECFEKALTIKPDYVEVHYSLGVLFQELGKLESMIEHLEYAVTIEPSLSEAHNMLGIAYKELGQFDDSIESYLKALDINPNFSEAYNNLGNTYTEVGQLDDAVESYLKALELNSDYPALHNNLGNAYKELGQHDNALKSYKNALRYNPDNADAHNYLGNVFNELGELDEALKSYKRAIAINPDYADAYNNLGNTLRDSDQLEEALKNFEKSVELNPNFPEAYNNLGNLLKELGRLDDSVDSFEKSIKISSNFAEAHNNYGNLLADLGRLDDSISSFKKAIEINPNFAAAYNNLGNVFKTLNRYKESIQSYEMAIEINPNFAEAYNNLGNLLTMDTKLLNQAVKSFEKAIEINPNFAIAHNNLGNAYKDLNFLDEALNSYERAFDIENSLDNVLGNILSTKMNSCNWDDLAELLDDAQKRIINNERVVEPFTLLGLIDDSAIQRKATELRVNANHPKNHTLPTIDQYPKHPKIRIGYFSADFRRHPLAYLTAELYELHDRDHFEVHAFSFGPDTQDEMNLRIKAGVEHFHNVQSMSNQEMALFVRSLEIDFAVDLGGFTHDARTDVFAMSAAPIQLSYIGYLGTMGTDYYDYLIADPVMIPQENQKHYVEKIVYLPSFQVNDSKDLPPEITLTRKDVDLPEEGFVFCCFNTTYKFTPAIFDSWARILGHVDNSVLIVYANNELSKINLTQEIVKRGIQAERLIFAGNLERPEYLARYRTVDLFLDTHPYNAGTTASDALKMGLPLLTMIGKSFNSREAASILTSMNLPELITNTPEEYEALAIELATHPEKLKAIKDKLASNLTTAPLYNTKLFVRNLESAYTTMYERHHEGLEPDHIYVE